MNNIITSMFNLQGLKITKKEFNSQDNELLLSCEKYGKTSICPYCLKRTKKIHQYKYRRIKHAISNNDQLVVLNLKIRRFKCSNCNNIFTEKIKGIDNTRMSQEFKNSVLDALRYSSFNNVMSKFNISFSSLKNILSSFMFQRKKHISKLLKNTTKIGIDEHSFRGKRMFITITDLSNNKLLTILPSDDQETIRDFLNSIPQETLKNIQEFCSDLRSGFKTLIDEVIKKNNLNNRNNITLVADRFHVELLALRMLDDVRKIIQEGSRSSKIHIKKILWKNGFNFTKKDRIKLNKTFDYYANFPKLKEAWIIKEKILDMYNNSKTRKEAQVKLEHIIMLCESISTYSRTMKAFVNTLKKWKENILNYFNNKTTNAFTEGCHTKIKMIKRISFGFRNPFNYIAKVMLAFVKTNEIYHTI